MNLPLEGTCQCGGVKYTLKDRPIMTYACHCRDCQKRTGSAFSLGALISASAIAIDGELSAWERTSDDGNKNTRYSCSSCGNIIYGVGSLAPEVFKLQPGTLVDTSDVSPDVHIWTIRAQKWISLPSEVPQFEQQPDDASQILAAAIEYQQRKSS